MNPFRGGSVVCGEYFFDRAEETSRVVETLAGGNNLVLFAPRRYGKTSLVFRAMAELESRGFACVYVDFLPIYDVADFCRVYARRVFEKRSGWQRLVAKFANSLKGVRARIALSAAGEASLELDFPEPAPDAAAIESVLELPERLAGNGKRIVVVFDEFQEISRFEKIRFEALLRSVVQRRQNVSYMFLGSKTHLMSAMFTERSRPFFNSATTMTIGKLPAGETADFLKRRFAGSGVAIDEAATRAIIECADGVPYYVQLLAAEVWQRVRTGDCAGATEAAVAECAEQILAIKSDYYAELYDRLSLVQKKLVAAIAHDGKSIFAAGYAKAHRIESVSGLQKAAEALLERGVVEKEKGEYRVADPFFRRFLAQLP